MVYSIEGAKIGNLKVLKKIEGNMKFPISQVGQSGKAPERSYACQYSTFYQNIINRDIRKSDFVMSSTWAFRNGLSVIPPTGENPRPREGTDVATMSYFYNELYVKHFNALSSKMYGDSANSYQCRKKPSYLGMVVVSHTIDDSDKHVLTDIYGQDTIWEKIGGRFLLTVGTNLANSNSKYGNNTRAGDFNFASSKRTGGTPEVLLTVKNIASHTHTLCENGTPLPIGTLPEREKPLEPEITGGGEYGICSTPGAAGSPDWGKGFGDIGALATQVGGIESLHHTNMPASRGHGGKFSNGWHNTRRQNEPGTWASGPISPSDLWGGGIQTKEVIGTFQAKFTVGEMTDTCSSKTPLVNVPHNNIPPLVVEYIWERVL